MMMAKLVTVLCLTLSSIGNGLVSNFVNNKAHTQLNMQHNKNDRISSSVVERRTVFASIIAAGILGGNNLINRENNEAMALDFDAFIKAEIDADTKNCDPKRDPKCMPEFSKDEALCKYGQSGNARGEACKRFKASGGALKPKNAVKETSPGGAYAM